ncbi:cellobiohydrolase I [Zalerion maritima]|uniref:cellulose 1,4-beta-cellobiosidase (non-reducing end) n=1 Tax=Zalerion maritima TaxID=339359 RepID=A0AAD5RV47_9PEZI|nr:cellobiohydrolase I [Zalerion maritima]
MAQLSEAAVLAVLVASAAAQQAGTEQSETHPSMSWKQCSSGGSCTTVQGSVVIDSNWRWVHNVDGDLDCGLNGAVYFVMMDSDGGMSRYSTNQAGAKYGTGYCDAQCARDPKFVGGEGNYEGWGPSTNDANAGVGNLGGCCAGNLS